MEQDQTFWERPVSQPFSTKQQVNNLLSVTRIEDGTMKLRLNTELLEEIVHEAVKHVEKRSKEHSITVHFSDSLLLVKADARLIVQVLINLMDNAIRGTAASDERRLSFQMY